eukprot:scaffold118772_cov30-Phaeocystis_antarctica.AAC.1
MGLGLGIGFEPKPPRGTDVWLSALSASPAALRMPPCTKTVVRPRTTSDPVGSRIVTSVGIG